MYLMPPKREAETTRKYYKAICLLKINQVKPYAQDGTSPESSKKENCLKRSSQCLQNSMLMKNKLDYMINSVLKGFFEIFYMLKNCWK